MELVFVIWAVGTLPSFASAIVFFGFLLMILSFLAYVFGSIIEKADSSQEDKDIAAVVKKIASRTLFVVVPVWFMASMIPDKTTSYQMLAAYGVQKVVENPQAQSLASDGVDVLKALMEKAKKELAESTK
jgi:hypothetical protein